jgi:HK97 family phage major capsid protein
MKTYKLLLDGTLVEIDGDQQTPFDVEAEEAKLVDVSGGGKMLTLKDGTHHVVEIEKPVKIDVQEPDSVEAGLKQIQDLVLNSTQTAASIKLLAESVRDVLKENKQSRDSIDDINADANKRRAGWEIDPSAVIAQGTTPDDIMKAFVPGVKIRRVRGGQMFDEVAPSDPDSLKLYQFQKLADRVHMLHKLTGRKPTEFKAYEKLQDFMIKSGLAKALNTSTDGSGQDWVPSGFSSRLFDKVRLLRRVSALFEIIPMPTKTLQPNVLTSDAQAYYIPENINDEGTKFRASTPGTGNFTLTAKKMGVRVVSSNEEVEDSIVAILPFLERNIAQTLANGWENAIMNGDDSASHMDSNVTESTDVRKMWKGLRKLASAKSAEKDLGSAIPTVDLLHGVIEKMGKPYNIMRENLAWILSAEGYLLLLKDSNLLTTEKYGNFATLLTGEIGRVWNIPAVISEFSQSDLNSTGVYQSGQTQTTAQLVYLPGFVIGSREGVKLDRVFDAELDQHKVVAKQRGDFADVYGTGEKTVASGINLDSAS